MLVWADERSCGRSITFAITISPPVPYIPATPSSGLSVCCSSPERFLCCLRGSVLEARPIKGTAPRRPADPQVRCPAQQAAWARGMGSCSGVAGFCDADPRAKGWSHMRLRGQSQTVSCQPVRSAGSLFCSGVNRHLYKVLWQAGFVDSVGYAQSSS